MNCFYKLPNLRYLLNLYILPSNMVAKFILLFSKISEILRTLKNKFLLKQISLPLDMNDNL